MTAALKTAADDARINAYAPYSGFRVGAALRSTDGRVFVGCNVENSAYAGICAERSALSAAVVAGAQDLAELVITSDDEEPVAPCGACRQALAELAPDLPVTSYGMAGASARWTIAELLPHQFRLNAMNGKSE